MNIRKLLSRFIVTTSVVCIAALASTAAAQSYPAKPISVVFGGGTGTPVESAFRLIAAEAAKPLGQPPRRQRPIEHQRAEKRSP